MEFILDFIGQNSQEIIFTMVGIIVVISIAWVIVAFMTPELDLEAQSIQDLTALNEVKSELRAREIEVDRLKSQIEKHIQGGGAEASTGDNSNSDELNQKIKELEEKLSDYEIIEDDIADLSRFKQENEELKKKISELKGELPREAQADMDAEAAAEKEKAADTQVEEEDEGEDLDVEGMAQRASKVSDSDIS